MVREKAAVFERRRDDINITRKRRGGKKRWKREDSLSHTRVLRYPNVSDVSLHNDDLQGAAAIQDDGGRKGTSS